MSMISHSSLTFSLRFAQLSVLIAKMDPLLLGVAVVLLLVAVCVLLLGKLPRSTKSLEAGSTASTMTDSSAVVSEVNGDGVVLPGQ